LLPDFLFQNPISSIKKTKQKREKIIATKRGLKNQKTKKKHVGRLLQRATSKTAIQISELSITCGAPSVRLQLLVEIYSQHEPDPSSGH
jgi:hypothetical protein